MDKQRSVLLLTLLCIVQVHSVPVESYGIIDEAKEQLEILRTIITAAIHSAFDGINDSVQDAHTSFLNTQTDAQLTIEEAYQNQLQLLNAVKALAEAAGKGIGFCLLLEETFNKYPIVSIENIRSYTETIKDDMQDVETSSKYKIDVLINEVEVLDFQLNQCGEEFLCAAPVISRIEAAMITLPQKVEVETLYTINVFEMHKLSHYTFSQSHVAEVTAEGTRVVEAIAACADMILSAP